jgi:hypothetical protein
VLYVCCCSALLLRPLRLASWANVAASSASIASDDSTELEATLGVEVGVEVEVEVELEVEVGVGRVPSCGVVVVLS